MGAACSFGAFVEMERLCCCDTGVIEPTPLLSELSCFVDKAKQAIRWACREAITRLGVVLREEVADEAEVGAERQRT